MSAAMSQVFARLQRCGRAAPQRLHELEEQVCGKSLQFAKWLHCEVLRPVAVSGFLPKCWKRQAAKYRVLKWAAASTDFGCLQVAVSVWLGDFTSALALAAAFPEARPACETLPSFIAECQQKTQKRPKLRRNDGARSVQR